MAKTASDQAPRGLTPLQIGIVALLVAALLGSVGRRYLHRSKAQGGTPAGATGLVADGGKGQTEPTPVERALPYVTEGSLFGLIGFALGYASRKFVKLGLIVLALFFVGLQALAWTGS